MVESLWQAFINDCRPQDESMAAFRRNRAEQVSVEIIFNFALKIEQRSGASV